MLTILEKWKNSTNWCCIIWCFALFVQKSSISWWYCDMMKNGFYKTTKCVQCSGWLMVKHQKISINQKHIKRRMWLQFGDSQVELHITISWSLQNHHNSEVMPGNWVNALRNVTNSSWQHLTACLAKDWKNWTNCII